jgi:hypothetical protein
LIDDSMNPSTDEQLQRVLNELGIEEGALIARGGEATVYRYDRDHIARISHSGTGPEEAALRTGLLMELAPSAGGLSFLVPSVKRSLLIQERAITIEPWIPGETLEQAMGKALPQERQCLAVNVLEAASELGKLAFYRTEYRDLFWDPPTSASSWRQYLERRARRSLERAGEDFARVDPVALAAPFELHPDRGFLHYDCHPQNILVQGGRVTGILDFGGMCMCGDPRFDPLSVAIYMGAGAHSDDSNGVRETCREWLGDRDLLQWLRPTEAIVAAIWSFAQDDPGVAKWTRRVLLGESA